MAEIITLEGSILPSAHLARGERQDFRSDDPLAETLVLGGYAVVVDARTVTDAKGKESADSAELEPPKRNASRDDWAEYLAQHPHGFVTEGKDRAALLAEFDALDATD